MARLTEAIDRLADVAELQSTRKHREEFATRPLELGQMPAPLRATELLLGIPGGFEIVRDHMEGVDAAGSTITCECDDELDLEPGQLERCSCLRVYLRTNERTLATSRPGPDDEVACDHCGSPKQDLRVRDGVWVANGDVDQFVCRACEIAFLGHTCKTISAALAPLGRRPF